MASGNYPSSVPLPVYPKGADYQGFVTLTTDWQDFQIDLSSRNLSHVIDGFAWVVARDRLPHGVTIDIDDIKFSK